MVLKDLLIRNESKILRRWLELILGTYPPDIAAVVGRERDRFTNPVGFTISKETESIFRMLCEGKPAACSKQSLESIVKIRSVQDFSPSAAVVFVFLLKEAIFETIGSEISGRSIIEEWQRLQSKIDELALQAFDIYSDCREKICQIKVNRARADREMAFRMMERMNLWRHKSGKGDPRF